MTMGFARPQYLVETDWLAQHLEDPGVRVLECTVNLPPAPEQPGGFRVESGRAKWAEGHIPGAGFVDLPEELSDRTSTLRFMMPPAAQFAEAMGRAGVGDGVRVILYDRAVNMWAARVWWMLRAFGFDDAAVLNGGFKKWMVEGRPLSTDAGVRPARPFTLRPRPALMTDKAGVLAALGDSGSCVLNALAVDRHRGTGGVPYGRPGRIAGSVNVPAQELVDPATHAYLDADVLRAKFQAAGVLDAKRVVTYCGAGIAASSDAFVLTLLGRDDVAVYDASLLEWANDPTLPMERD
jgi:thiosulfate/3-mercaptopyruvate sulfurtransferase